MRTLKKYSGFAIALIIILFLPFGLPAQSNGKNKVVYAELLGAGVFGSVNYDFRFKPGSEGLGMRIGAGMVPDVLIIPIEINGLMMNLNWTPMINTDEIWAVWFGLGIGYSWNK